MRSISALKLRKSAITYPKLDLKIPDVPLRSRLYPISPVGLGTPYVESLVSYMCRLATAHNVSFGSLYELLLIPILNKAYLTTPSHLSPASTLNGSFRERMKSINGVGKLAQEWVGMLEALTLRNDLRFLTLAVFSEVIPHWKLLRRFQAWCPECYQEMRQAEQTIYQPLLWAIVVVDTCIRHNRPLIDRCHHCHRQLLPLTRRAKHGFCPRCGYWLGGDTYNKGALNTLPLEEREWRLFIASSIGDLLSAIPNMNHSLTNKMVLESLNTCIAISTGGVITQFAKLIRKPLITVCGWARGTVKIPLWDLIRICYCLNLSILSFLKGADTVRNSDVDVREFPDVTHVVRIPRNPKTFNHKKVESQLTNFLDVVPPISMAEAARRVGISHRDLYRKFPELCSKISSRYRYYLQDFYMRHRAEREEEVRQAVIHLYSQGFYVSQRLVADYLNKPSYFGRRDVAAIVRETRRLLDSKKKAG